MSERMERKGATTCDHFNVDHCWMTCSLHLCECDGECSDFSPPSTQINCPDPGKPCTGCELESDCLQDAQKCSHGVPLVKECPHCITGQEEADLLEEGEAPQALVQLLTDDPTQESTLSKAIGHLQEYHRGLMAEKKYIQAGKVERVINTLLKAEEATR